MYKIDSSIFKSIFAVPSEIVDKHILTASSVSIKVLLLILRNAENGINVDEMAQKLNMSASYLSTIENGKRNIPPDMEDLLIRAYNLSDKDKEKLRKAMVDSSDTVKIDLTDLAEKKKRMIYEITKGDLDEATIDQLCKIISDKKGEGK